MSMTLPHAQELLLFHFGPVQDFIEQARSCRDLWSGSYLLSWLTGHALKAVTDVVGADSVVFPSLRGNGIFAALHPDNGKAGERNLADWLLTPTLPNRFLAVVPSGRGAELARAAERAIRGELDAIAGEVWKWLAENDAAADWKPRFDAQVRTFPQISWAVQPGADHGGPPLPWAEQYERVHARLAARRNTRDFAKWPTDGGGAVKDSLSGREECIGDEAFWKNLAEKHEAIFTAQSHRYGAMNLIKRLWCRDDRVPYLRDKLGLRKSAYQAAMGFESTEEIAADKKYIAILSMDGDEMGKWLSGEKTFGPGASASLTPAYHRRFSEALARFADGARDMVERHGGELLYAGGDDVLAILPASAAVACAEELRKAFRVAAAGDACDLSGGLAVGHHKAPLQMLVAEARAALSRAKAANGYGRSALAVSVYKRSGEILHWGCKWDSPALELMAKTTEYFSNEALPGRFPYALAGLLEQYRLGDAKNQSVDVAALKAIITEEFAHVLERQGRGLDGEKEPFRELARRYLDGLPAERLADFMNLFLVETFLNRFGREA